MTAELYSFAAKILSRMPDPRDIDLDKLRKAIMSRYPKIRAALARNEGNGG